MLTARTAEADYIEAQTAERGPDYLCRHCKAPVVLHSGLVRPKHFQHYPNASCVLGARMSEAHYRTQLALAESLRSRQVAVELEVWLPGALGDRRIDVLAHPGDRPQHRVAIEVQQADQTLEAIIARSSCYRADDIAPLWLRLTDFGRFHSAERLSTGEIWIDRFPLRSWERWAHDEAGGHLWYCDSGTGRLWRGRFLPAFSWREGSEWYEPGGIYNSIPGGYVEVKRWVGLALQGPFDVAELRLKRGLTKAITGGDSLIGSFEPPVPLAPKLKRELRIADRREECPLQVCRNGVWGLEEAAIVSEDWRA